ncbi:MAG: NAD(+) synthase [Muribaculaceae bacterium]|nr:NAD(+) synthase [Muribaculaceae bacterium]
MDNYGYFRLAAACPEVRPGDIDFNLEKISSQISECAAAGAQLVVFPELSLTGYTCGDLFGQQLLLDRCVDALNKLSYQTRGINMAVVVGAPLRRGTRLYNCAIVIQEGKLRGVVPKSYIPNYGEFYEQRWFSSGIQSRGTITLYDNRLHQKFDCPFGTDLIFQTNTGRFGVEICEDVWVPIPPSCKLSQAGADIIANLSATDELIGKHSYLLDVIAHQSARCRCAYAYASAGAGESSTDLAFSGNCIIAENGHIMAKTERFKLGSKLAIADVDIQSLRHDRMHHNTFADSSEEDEFRIIKLEYSDDSPAPIVPDYREIEAHPFVDSNPDKLASRCDEISSIQAWGLAVRLKAIGYKHAVVGISGGLDSTLALLVTVKAFDMLGLDRKGIIGVTMPGFGTSDRTHGNADSLMELLGVSTMTVPIDEAVKLHFREIGHDGITPDITYENSQARERTQILMDIANLQNAIVIGTGDLSELALGWCTYNGDQMSMYAVNASVPKTLVKYLVGGYARTTDNPELRKVLNDIIDTPISPELLPAAADDDINQRTEDVVGPYELHDFFLYQILRHGFAPKKIRMLANKAFKGKYSEETIDKWLKTFYRRFFSQQFKRSCMPDGVKVGGICLSPRGDWRMPSDASAKMWLSELEN